LPLNSQQQKAEEVRQRKATSDENRRVKLVPSKAEGPKISGNIKACRMGT